MRYFLSLFFILSLSAFPVHSQILDKIKKTKEKIASVTIDNLSRDPITTSFKDVDKTKHFENNFGNDVAFESFFDQPFDQKTGFSLKPGYYEGTFQSFCIKAGTTPPVEGRGRFYAPIKGPKADIMTTIIDGYQGNEEITQREVQLLLWAIIAKADFAKMKGPVKVTAIKLLSPSQIARLSKGALDNLTRNQLKKVANETPAVRAVLEAENNLRKKYYAGARTYREYEEIAMAAGVEPIVPGFEAGRWTKHPDGYFIRYFPKGYAQTRTQVYVPKTAGAAQFNPSTDIAVPPNRGQRLLQTNLPSDKPGSNTGGYIKPHKDPFCEPVVNAAADIEIKKQIIMQNLPGLAVAVWKNGKMIHLKGYGYGDIYKKEPITINSVMKWASISKSVTGVAAAQLEERGVNGFKVSDTITDYVSNWGTVRYTDTTGESSGFDRRPNDIVIFQLLNNTSGIQQYGKGSRSGDNERYTGIRNDGKTLIVKFERNPDNYGDFDTGPRKFKAKEAVDVFNMSVLNDVPGMTYHYSSYGFVLAGAAIDSVAPKGYRAWVKDNIIDPAMLSSMAVSEERRFGHHMNNDGMLVSSKQRALESTIPAGGYESNICDLAKYARALSTGRFFEKDKEILWQNSVSASTGSGNYSYGLNYDGSGQDFRVWHGGKHGTTRSEMMFFPSDNSGVALLGPAVYADLPKIMRYIVDATLRPGLYNEPAHTPLDNCRSDMGNDEDMFRAVWRRTGSDVLIRTGLETTGFPDHMKQLRSSGYNVVDIETFRHGNKRYWDAVLKKGIARTEILVDTLLPELKNKIREMKINGYCVVDIEAHSFVGRHWAAVFSKENKRSATAFQMKWPDFLAEHNKHVRNGLKLVDIEQSRPFTDRLWSGIWLTGGDCEVEVNLEENQFATKRSEMRTQGYRLIDVEHYFANNDTGKPRVAAVWEKTLADEFVTGDLEDVNGDGIDDDGDTNPLQNFCDHMSTHHNKMMNYELIDWERVVPKISDN